ncbi:MAG: glycosyltransferase family 4 protein [archaeon]|jgi:glycosyltransferase involved in cell wall biosynthesis
MKILVLSTSFPRWKGDYFGVFVLELVKELAKKNSVKVLTPNFPKGKGAEKISGVEVRRFDYFFPRSAQKVIYPDGMPNQLKKSVLAKIEFPFFLGKFAAEAAKMAKTSDIILCNWALTGLIAEKSTDGRAKIITVLRGSDMQLIEKKGFMSKILLNSLKKADAVCVVTNDFAEPLRKLGIKKVFFTPNGVDEREFVPTKIARKKLGLGKEKIVLYMGSLIERKGVKYLIEAMKGVDAKLVIGGDGEEINFLKELAKAEGVDAKFLGQVPTDEMPLWISSCDVFVMPSLYEGRSNAVIRALMAGKATVATKIKGTKELIENGKTGYLVETKNPPALRKKIMFLLKNEKIRNRIGSNAKKIVLKKIPTWRESAKKYEKIFKAVSGKNL